MGHSHIDWDTWDLIDAVNRKKAEPQVIHKTEYVYVDRTPKPPEPYRYMGETKEQRAARIARQERKKLEKRKKFQQYLFEEFGWYSSLVE
jgi:hypothetical protein